MKKRGWIAGIVLMLILLWRPAAAVKGAREALAQWYWSVAPALFPFMLLLPMIQCDEALTFYEGALGGAMKRLFNLPGPAASTVMVGMLAGSPAGCAAARRAAADGHMDVGQLTRLAAAVGGVSPAFLVSGVGASMLGSARLGWVLLRTQFIVQVVMLFMLRPLDGGVRIQADAGTKRGKDNPMAGALVAILSVAGYMAFFGALTRVARSIVGETAGSALLCAMEVSSGARTISAMELALPMKLIGLSALTGFGGVCVSMQNYSFLKDMGVRFRVFLAARLEAGLMSAAITYLQLLWLPIPVQVIKIHPLPAAALLACVAVLPALLTFGRYNIWYEGNHSYTRSV